MKTRVSGVPYMVDMANSKQQEEDNGFLKIAEGHGYFDDFGRWVFQSSYDLLEFTDEITNSYVNDIATLEQENKLMRARMNRLEEECHWLEHQSRASKDDLK
jgi:hypothetical protein